MIPGYLDESSIKNQNNENNNNWYTTGVNSNFLALRHFFHYFYFVY